MKHIPLCGSLITNNPSQVQLPSYNFAKTQLVKHDILPANSTWTFLASSSISGACVVRYPLSVLNFY